MKYPPPARRSDKARASTIAHLRGGNAYGPHPPSTAAGMDQDSEQIERMSRGKVVSFQLKTGFPLALVGIYTEADLKDRQDGRVGAVDALIYGY